MTTSPAEGQEPPEGSSAPVSAALPYGEVPDRQSSARGAPGAQQPPSGQALGGVALSAGTASPDGVAPPAGPASPASTVPPYGQAPGPSAIQDLGRRRPLTVWSRASSRPPAARPGLSSRPRGRHSAAWPRLPARSRPAGRSPRRLPVWLRLPARPRPAGRSPRRLPVWLRLPAWPLPPAWSPSRPPSPRPTARPWRRASRPGEASSPREASRLRGGRASGQCHRPRPAPDLPGPQRARPLYGRGPRQ